MYYINVQFPFSSLNDEDYLLSVLLHSVADPTAVLSRLDAEREVFTRLQDTQDGNDTIYNYNGTLTGSVRAVDNERSDMYDPLVCSKLSFNMAVETFPDWISEFCDSRKARAVLQKVVSKGYNIEMWRGYIIGQTLNTTVVNKLLSVPLVACDEVTMAKYMPFAASLDAVTKDRWTTLIGMMEHYHNIHHTRGLANDGMGFEKLYSILGLSHSNRMMWHRDLSLLLDDGTYTNDIAGTLVVNFDRWIPDKTNTWETVFNELFEYLGVTFAVGSYGVMAVNDCYLLTSPVDLETAQKYVYIFNQPGSTTFSTDPYLTITNPPKYGANLQVTTEPDRYKEVKVTSEPERWKAHEYLTEEHYKPVLEGAEVRHRWGSTSNPSNGPYDDDFGWRKMIYIEPDAEEAEFVNIPNCVNGEGYTMANSGVLPCDDITSCDGKNHPDASCAGSLDFITFKEGSCCIKIGKGKMNGVDENKRLKPYFLIMNHMWNNMVNALPHTMSSTHIADTVWLNLRPLGYNGAVHPGDRHFLIIQMDVMFIRENFPIGSLVDGNPNQHNWSPALSVNEGMHVIDWRHPPMLLPSDETVFDFGDNNDPYHGMFNASIKIWNNLYFQAYIHIGKHYYNGTNWQVVQSGETPPKCNVTMVNSTTEIEEIDKYGFFSLKTGNYYYIISNPYKTDSTVDRLDNPKMCLALHNWSTHGEPVQGRLEMQILGQIHFQNTPFSVGNSIPFLLINNIRINYSDDAEFVDQDIKNTEKLTIDGEIAKETLEKELKMATPSVAGFFNNALVFDGGKAWHNLVAICRQNSIAPTTLEALKAAALRNQYCDGQVFVELETPVQYDTNVHNVGFRVQGLTEAGGTFLPVKREFDYTKETLRVKMMRRNTFSY